MCESHSCPCMDAETRQQRNKLTQKNTKQRNTPTSQNETNKQNTPNKSPTIKQKKVRSGEGTGGNR